MHHLHLCDLADQLIEIDAFGELLRRERADPIVEIFAQRGLLVNRPRISPRHLKRLVDWPGLHQPLDRDFVLGAVFCLDGAVILNLRAGGFMYPGRAGLVAQRDDLTHAVYLRLQMVQVYLDA